MVVFKAFTPSRDNDVAHLVAYEVTPTGDLQSGVVSGDDGDLDVNDSFAVGLDRNGVRFKVTARTSQTVVFWWPGDSAYTDALRFESLYPRTETLVDVPPIRGAT